MTTTAPSRRTPTGLVAAELRAAILAHSARIDAIADTDPEGDEIELEALRDIADAAVDLASGREPGRVCFGECVDARGGLSEPEFRHLIETLLGRPRQRYKDSPHYVFSELTTAQADTVTAYLRTLAVAYQRETVTRWAP